MLKTYKSIQPESEVILITAFGTMETAIEAVKAGAFDYISKPFKIDEVLLQVSRAIESRNLIRENRNLKRQLGSQGQLSSLVGRSPVMLEIYKKIAMVSDARSTVLIYGESGTGKELVAKAVHYNGGRASQRFFAVNCGALAESLLETGSSGTCAALLPALSRINGVFWKRRAGAPCSWTKFLKSSPALQVSLLRAIEEQEVRRVGSNQVIKTDVRFIAASNKVLGQLVEEGKFRADLYYRLRVVEINMPPLRERTEDIPLLVEHFLKRLGRERKQSYSVSNQTLSALISYEWPGNVRELENALEAAVALNRSGVVTLEDLPPKVRPGSQNGDRLERLHADLPSLDELAKRYLLHVLKVTRDNKARAASIMGIDRKTLYRMVERFKLRF